MLFVSNVWIYKEENTWKLRNVLFVVGIIIWILSEPVLSHLCRVYTVYIDY